MKDCTLHQPLEGQDQPCASLWRSLEDLVRSHVREFVEEIVEDEVACALDRTRYARGGNGYRNGHRERTLLTTFGPMSLQVPRARIASAQGEREFRSSVLPKSRRLTQNAEALIIAAYLCGVSTRRSALALAQALGPGVSKSTVARCLERLRPQWKDWQRRDLSEEGVVRLMLDGLCVNVRMDSRSERISILVAMGVRSDGRKVVLALHDMGGESKEAWRALLDDLSARGLKEPQVCTVDGGKGLESALAHIWPNALIQRCTVHKERNLLAHAPERMHEELKLDYAEMMYAQDAVTALARRRCFLSKWRAKCPKVAKSLEEGGERLFTFLRFPPEQWKSLRTTNSIERLHQEYRRRIKVQGVLPAGESVCMLFWALLASGAVTLRRVDGFHSFLVPPVGELDLAA